MSDRARRGRILAAVGATQLIIILNGSIVNVALPSLQADLGLDLTYASWVITSYALAFGGCLLLGGRIADSIGGGRAFVIGMAGFVVASVVIGLAPGGPMLIAGRTAQGLAASLIAPAGLSILTSTFRTSRERTRALGVYVLMATCGGAIGLVAGGILTSVLSWRWCFLIVVPFGIAAFLIVMVDVRMGGGHPVRIEVLPAALITLTASGITLAVVEYPVPWISLTALTVALASGLIFAHHQRRAKETLIPPGVFRGVLPIVGLIGAAGGSFVMMATGTLVSLFLQDVLSLSALTTGLMLVAAPISIALGTSIGTALMPRTGPFSLIVAGMTFIGAGALVLTQLSPSSRYAWDVLPALALNGIGMGLIGVATLSAVLAGARASEGGIASAGQQMVQQIFGAIGLAVLFATSQAIIDASGDFGAAATAEGIVGAQWVAVGASLTTVLIIFGVRLAGRRARRRGGNEGCELGFEDVS